MSGAFVGRAATHLTARRAALLIGGALTLAIVVVIVAPLVGVTMDRDGRHLGLISPAALWGSGTTHVILVKYLLPRVLAGFVVGAALAVAGAALQAQLRNPLAEPYTLGISSGSALAAVIAIRAGIEPLLGDFGIGGAALLGAVATLAVVWRLGRVGRHLPPATMVLAGVTVSMCCSAASVLIQYTADFAEVSHILHWTMGGLDKVHTSTLGPFALAIAVGVGVLLLQARALNAMAAGNDAAASVGVDVARTETLVFTIASLLVGAAIAVAGPIGFVGLVVPHAVRSSAGADHRVLLPLSAILGGVLVVLCDLVARTIIAPNQLPVSVVTALLGGPFFLYILLRRRRGVLWER